MSVFGTSTTASRATSAWGHAAQVVNQAAERLATGKRINRASDDPAGLAAADNLRVREAEIRKSLDSLEFNGRRDAATEGAHSVVQDLLLNLQGHVLAASNRSGLSKAELAGHQSEVESILDTINFLGQTTTFNGEQILAGVSENSLASSAITDPATHETTSITLGALRSGGKLDLLHSDPQDLEAAAKLVEQAIAGTSQVRAGIGMRLKDADSTRRTLLSELEGVAQTRSSIEDADFAAETANLIRGRTQQSAAGFAAQFAMKQNADLVLTLLG